MNIIGHVLVAENDELFLAGGSHTPLDYVLGIKTVSSAALRNFSLNLKRRQAFSQKIGASYVHIVAPDKHTVVRDGFPFQDFTTPGDIVFENHPQIIFPKIHLMEMAGCCRPYYKTDTHWTIHGMLKAMELVLRAFGLEEDIVSDRIAEVALSIHAKEGIFVGDLGSKLSPSPGEIAFELRSKISGQSYNNGVSGNNGKMQYIKSEHPAAKGRLLAFADSFTFLYSNIFRFFFKETILCRTPHFHKEIALSVVPDFIFTQAAERYIPDTVSDSHAPPFLLMPALSGKQTNFSPDAATHFAELLKGNNWK